MRKTVRVALSVLQALLLGGIFVIQRLSVTKMGVMRLVVYQNRLWNAALPAFAPCLIAAVLLAACLYAVRIAIRAQLNDRFCWLVLALLAAVACAAILLLNTTVLRTYYYVIVLLLFITLIQFFKCRFSQKKV